MENKRTPPFPVNDHGTKADLVIVTEGTHYPFWLLLTGMAEMKEGVTYLSIAFEEEDIPGYRSFKIFTPQEEYTPAQWEAIKLQVLHDGFSCTVWKCLLNTGSEITVDRGDLGILTLQYNGNKCDLIKLQG